MNFLNFWLVWLSINLVKMAVKAIVLRQLGMKGSRQQVTCKVRRQCPSSS
jgi:hypothetical protein